MTCALILGDEASKNPLFAGLGPTALLPLFGRPFIQRQIEMLVAQRVTRLEIVVDRGTETIQEFVGNGQRWGCEVRYRWADIPIDDLRLRTSDLIIADGSTLPEFRINRLRLSSILPRPPLALQLDLPGSMEPAESTGWGWLPYEAWGQVPTGLTPRELQRLFVDVDGQGTVEIAKVANAIAVSSARGLLEAHHAILSGEFRLELIPEDLLSEGVWIGRNVHLDPRSEIHPPVFIGDDCRAGPGVRIGPYTALGPDCVVDEGSRVTRAVVLPGSYVGAGLTIQDALVHGANVFDLRANENHRVAETLLLRPMSTGIRTRMSAQLRKTRLRLAESLSAIFDRETGRPTFIKSR